MERSDLIHGRALSFFAINRPAGGRRIRFKEDAFGLEVLQHAVGIPLLQGHHYARHLGTVLQMWPAPLGLMFAARLDGPHAALGRRLVRDGAQLSISGLFASKFALDDIEDVTQMCWLQELSLVQEGASPWTWTHFGKPSNAPMIPLKWWRGSPPLPLSLTPEMRLKAQRRLKCKTELGQIHDVLERVAARHHRIEAALRDHHR